MIIDPEVYYFKLIGNLEEVDYAATLGPGTVWGQRALITSLVPSNIASRVLIGFTVDAPIYHIPDPDENVSGFQMVLTTRLIAVNHSLLLEWNPYFSGWLIISRSQGITFLYD